MSDDKSIAVAQIFNDIKDRKHKITDEDLNQIYDQVYRLANKYAKSNQLLGLYKLLFILDTIEKEHQLVKMGINTFIYRDDIEKYIDSNKESVVKLIELSKYERDIPDEIVEVINNTKTIFDELYIVFTDYTQKTTRRVEAVKKEKDPILFGVFFDKDKRVCVDRFYFLGDWEDEYCDLTLDKMVASLNEQGIKPLRTITEPKTVDELRQLASQYKEKTNVTFVLNNTPPKKKSFFSKIRTFFHL